MKIDHDKSLEYIRGCGPRTLSKRLLEIGQGYSVANEKSLDSMEVLKCFRLAKLDSTTPRSRNASKSAMVKVLEAVETNLFTGTYIAISYCWKPSPGEDEARGKYRVPSSNRRLKLRDGLLDRIIRYARYVTNQECGGKDVPFWIDQLSINQRDRDERNTKVQSMDLVYKNCKAAAGYLWVKIQTQKELDTLGIS